MSGASAASRSSRWRDGLTMVLVVVTSLAVLAAVIGLWARSTLLDTDRFMAAFGPTVDDPDFYAAVGDFAADEVVVALELERRIEASLAEIDRMLSLALRDAVDVGERAERLLDRVDRPGLASLAPAIAAPVEQRVADTVRTAVTSDAVGAAVPRMVREGHAGIVALADGDLDRYPNVYLADGEVRLNLLTLIAMALPDVTDQLRSLLPALALPTSLADRPDRALAQMREALGDAVPEDVGQLTLLTEPQLGGLRQVVRQLRLLTTALVVIAVGFVIATIVQSRRRRVTVLRLAVALAVVVLMAAVVVRHLQGRLTGALTEAVDGAVVASLVDGVLSGLRNLLVTFLVVVALLALTAHAAGRPAWLTGVAARLRRSRASTAGTAEPGG